MADSVTIAEVALKGLLYSFDRCFDYVVPAQMPLPVPGCRVTVGFGAGNSKKTAMVLALKSGSAEGLKPILSRIDDEPIVNAEQLELARYIADRTFCCLYDALRLMFPAGLDYVAKTYYKVTEKPYLGGDEPQRSVLAFLSGRAKAEEKAICAACGCAPEVLADMSREGLLARESDSQRRVGDLLTSTWRLAEGAGAQKLTEKQQAVVNYLRENGETSRKQLLYYTGVSAAVGQALEKKGVIIGGEEKSYRSAYVCAKATDSPDNYTLNTDQQKAFEKLAEMLDNGGGAALLFGVTGSGKTMVLLKCVQKVLESGKGAILMVPEILLTPQFVKLFTACFGPRVAVIHSALSDGVRLDEHRRIASGEADLVIGTRSAVFAPVKNLGLISMDEEQESAYRSESSPRYDAGEVAARRAAAHKALFLRMSATPSIKSRYCAQRGKYEYITLSGRFGSAVLPQVTVVDMCQEQPVIPGGVIGPTLCERLTENHAAAHQSVLLLNRRGHDTVVICYDCGEVIKCPNCSVAMNYHSANHRLMCHYCGYSLPEAVCGKCGSRRMRYFGSGTQKLEEELATLVSGAKVLRMDTDSTMTRSSHDKLFCDFAEGRYDILIGTQMVAKGLDFENVTLAGVLNAEQGLFSGDFKGAERTFSLLTQVVGRCGRGRYPGSAVIQTYLPEHRILEYAKNQDYEGFYNEELGLRKQLLYPPFCDVCLLGISGPDEEKTRAAAKELSALLCGEVSKTELPLKAYGPAPAHAARVAGKYRWRITLKCKNSAALRAIISDCLRKFAKSHAGDEITAFADMDNELYY